MRIVHQLSGCIGAFCLLALTAGCMEPQHPIHADDATKSHDLAPSIKHAACPHVPDPVAGIVPPQPSGGAFVLTPSHWEWVDGRYAFMAPRWTPRPEGAARTWQDGYWESNGGACVWHNGRFLPPPAL